MKKFLAARYAFTKNVRKILAQFVSLAYYIYIYITILSIDSGRALVVCALRRINDDDGKIVLHRAFNFPHSTKGEEGGGGSSTPLAELYVCVSLRLSHSFFFFLFFSFPPYIHTFRLILPQDMSVQNYTVTWWGWAEGVNKDTRESLYLPVPFSPLGRMRASYRPGPRMLSSTCFSFSRKFTFACVCVCVHLEKTQRQYRQWGI